MTKHFNTLMEKVLNENASKELYWILGKAKPERFQGKTVMRPFLQACDEKPGLIKESFVYEVDNKRGVKTLLWVLHPDGTMQLPTLKKSIRPAISKGDNCRQG